MSTRARERNIGPAAVFALPMNRTTLFSDPRRRLALAAVSLATCLLAGLLVVSFADGARKTTVLGASKVKDKPTCPRKGPARDCQANARVTGFQTAIKGKKKIFKAPSTGHIVAWSIELARPPKDARDFFEATLDSKKLGSDPWARIALLKAEGKARFKLTKQTPAVNLASSLGDEPIFSLRNPLRVKRGRILALTVPTWATNFVDDANRRSQWLASRNGKRCEFPENDPEKAEENLAKSRPHQRVGSTRKYGCRYNGGRILYTVYFLPKKKKK